MSEITSILEPLATVICDDVRREISGKDVIVGAYGGNLIVGRFPTTLMLAFWIQLNAREAGTRTVQFRISGPPESEHLSVAVKAAVAKEGPSAIFLPPTPIVASAPFELVVQMQEEGAEWRDLRRVQIEKGELAPEKLSPFLPPAGSTT
jgi:hypothetical protein